MDAIKKKMQAMKLEKDNAMDRKVQPQFYSIENHPGLIY
jgi:hypothetical protein